ncbi:sulfate adenylyltransferase subunit CysN [Rhodobacteraceae bacterium RKSG542]|uniref:sulfate adenylyltransferase subunit CysN n=1 Tax=Pseudovibrio flavus TaxID=2529854 RepID=UPI0012BC38AC|nr:sulfate adenylyltransferase subunit CysN [Pseudovibrio flavus]MTI17558.1 sulfate adenylyltransferase subunit CysN [Pseudovibrio flavus]
MGFVESIQGREVFSSYIASQENKGLLRFLTCGSVDDGKSTLIGRLLYDSKLIFEDQLSALERDSKKHGTVGEDIDLALLVDGLEAEREQGITIDVAYRFFATDKRKFIVADTPGHEQYTRNMATGASTADLAVLLVDARKGMLTQTRRHAFIASLLGVRHVVLAVNKIDLAGYDQARFEEIKAEFEAFIASFEFDSSIAIPISARFGDNVSARSLNLGWFDGPTLMEHLETVDFEDAAMNGPIRFPVQWVNRPDHTFRGYSGTVSGGILRKGDQLAVASSGKTSIVERLVTYDGELEEAHPGQAVTVTLKDELDISRGDVLGSANNRPEVSDQFASHLIWMSETPLYAGRPYILKIGGRTVTASVTEIKHKIDVNSFEHLSGKQLDLNEIAFCNLSTAQPIAFDPYEANKDTGSFILIDRMTNETVAAGLIWFGLRRATNVHRQALNIDKTARAQLMGQKPVVLWFTGLSGSGKSTIANALEQKLHDLGKKTYILDGDNVRHGLNRDLGFTEADRVENIRRVAETAKLFVDAGVITLVSFISPFKAERQMARELMEEGEFYEVYVDTPFDDCAKRDPKGLYARALAGEIKNFTGLDSPYEPPEAPEITISTQDATPDALAERILERLQQDGVLSAI